MKKIILLSIVVFGSAMMLQAQTSPSSNVRTMSVEEANKLNGVAQPTINGKPYSQYKAEQDALKQQQNNKKIALPSDIVALNITDAKAVKPEQQKPGAVVAKTEGKESSEQPKLSLVPPAATPVVVKPNAETGDTETLPAKPVATELPKPVMPSSNTPAKKQD